VSWFVPPRRPGHEWLDDPALPSEEMAASLGDLAGVDRAWGGSSSLARWLLARIPPREGRTASILDLGAGSALPTRKLRRHLAQAGIDARVFALDLQWRHLAAGACMDGPEPLPGLAADAFRLPLLAGSVDWVVATLLLHHFSPDELSNLFLEIRRVARLGFALLDLRRHRAPLAFVAVAGRLAFQSRVSVHDGVASVRQAYTPEELRAIVATSAPRARVERVFPFRILVSSSKPSTLEPLR
jgi:ubiquinone/menaquinone biosynthesis C-methylase UbiE